MRNEQMPQWLGDLVSSEVKQIVKKAQDDKLADIEKRIDEAKTPEELDKLEQELKELESSAEDSGSEDKDTVEDTDEPQEGVEKADAESNDNYDEDSEEDDSDTDPVSLAKDVKDIKKEISTGQEKTQEKLLHEIEQLNDQMGLNKIVDLNNTVEQ